MNFTKVNTRSLLSALSNVKNLQRRFVTDCSQAEGQPFSIYIHWPYCERCRFYNTYPI
ncbi:hypothetical protein BC943DRAFT_327760 [Umbelopsis sp. AD052]|nr:hypothetical protein BC943DRAFT_327760 [Umbelopsis sp. AD052]